jgi:hypothetical protein
MGHHLNFRDPDGIALELCAANQLALTARAALASGHDIGRHRGLRGRARRPGVCPAGLCDHQGAAGAG